MQRQNTRNNDQYLDMREKHNGTINSLFSLIHAFAVLRFHQFILASSFILLVRYPFTISSTKQFCPPGLVSHFETTTLFHLLKMNSSKLCKPQTEIAAKNNRILKALTINKFLQQVATNVLFVTASSATILTPENEESSRVTDVLKHG